MGDGRVKVKLIRDHRRSRGRESTRTFTLLRGLRDDAERADLLELLAVVLPLLEGVPAECCFGRERFRVERVERRRDHGRWVKRAHFVGELEIFRDRARRRRRVRRAEKRSREAAARALRRKITARASALYLVRRAAASAVVPRLALMLGSIYPASHCSAHCDALPMLSALAILHAFLARALDARGAPIRAFKI